MKIILISDTHYTIDNRIYKFLEKCDEIWHAGDIGSMELIDDLQKYGKVRAVWGNIDNHETRKELKQIEYFKCDKLKVMMTHIGGYPKRYSKGIKQKLLKFKPDLFISGHSHILKIVYDKELNLIHMNPGSIGNEGIHKIKTLISFEITKNKINNVKVIELEKLSNSIS
tara:strand:+ start:11015 stop:11521 length:507 start_codon:yes stop_codon:yes gene_type:complete